MTLVVKIGGGAGVATTAIVQEIARLVAEGERVVLLHGGSDLTNTLSERLGHPMRMITSPSGMTSRYTDSETLQIFAMAVAGQINTELVAQLQQAGVNAFGMAGVDGRLLVARRKAVVRSVTPEGRVQILRDDYTGQIEQVNSALVEQLLSAGYTPVIAPLALSHQGERLNVDGDRAAAAVAAALHADTLAIMTNVPGLLQDPQDASTLIETIPAAQLDTYMQYARGRMRKKLLGAQEALQGGVSRVCIGSASLRAVINGAGTTITTAESEEEEEQRTASDPRTTEAVRQTDTIHTAMREMVSLS
ncbi:[LysW]-aminoadipate kinase [Dictyobacter aurantiacus]|uniref:Putative [LysW]-aminoadipate kinase n=1 Tax=Dictyobacter aurantiacus TaxID=1936993 RepID=A0A401ZG42_9CHLR|nr:[LysW]-aminoadipate kinase [Dictyobacter aurantiacus]GCE05860.1 acetylglutamate kinase [Dictyobacter aurantiacus]